MPFSRESGARLIVLRPVTMGGDEAVTTSWRGKFTKISAV